MTMKENKKINVNGIDIAYTSIGSGNPLILVHGNGENKEIFDKLAEELQDRFTVYALDSRCHGESGSGVLTYMNIANDVKEFIVSLGLTNVTFLGFSDGGIVGLLLAINYKDLIDRYYVLGANTYPKGMKSKVLSLYRIAYFFFRDKKIGLMLREPNITKEELNSIKSECVIIAGENDIIRREHTQMIADNIKNSKLIILEGENHSSYVVNSGKLKTVIE